MKLITYRYQQEELVGVLFPDLSKVLPVGEFGLPYTSMNELIEHISSEEIGKLACFDEESPNAVRYKKEDFNGERPYPVYFCKRVNEGTIDGHWNIQERLDYEAELGVIIGKDTKNVKKEDAYDYIFGYTIINDISSRDLQV